jgi:hypothetical protein
MCLRVSEISIRRFVVRAKYWELDRVKVNYLMRRPGTHLLSLRISISFDRKYQIVVAAGLALAVINEHLGRQLPIVNNVGMILPTNDPLWVPYAWITVAPSLKVKRNKVKVADRYLS